MRVKKRANVGEFAFPGLGRVRGFRQFPGRNREMHAECGHSGVRMADNRPSGVAKDGEVADLYIRQREHVQRSRNFHREISNLNRSRIAQKIIGFVLSSCRKSGSEHTRKLTRGRFCEITTDNKKTPQIFLKREDPVIDF